MITIEWASTLNRNGTRKKPPASTIHGWLAKWRGTFLGDERLRSLGMREMREARAMRRYRGAKKQQANAASMGKSIFSLFKLQRKKPKRILSRTTRSRTSAGGGGTARAKQSDRITQALRSAKTKGQNRTRMSHKPKPRNPAPGSRLHRQKQGKSDR